MIPRTWITITKTGMCYLYSNVDKSKAIQYFVKAADKKDVPKDVYYQMGKALLIANLFDEAIEAFEKYKEVNKGQVNPKF
jgi:tetratricopeptide (TPR) repeat protein